MSFMFENATLSTSNYDKLLNGWAAQSVQNGVSFHAGNSQYSPEAAEARQSLIDDDGWTITDGEPAQMFSGGSGSEGDPYHVASLDDLRYLSEHPFYWDYHFKQTADIDASDTENWNDNGLGGSYAGYYGFSPIGNNLNNFSGSYDGGGYKIDNLFINRPSTDYIGLFGSTAGATITNTGVTNVDITGKMSVGTLVGYSENTNISDSYATGFVTGDFESIGGILGENNSGTSIARVYANVTVDCDVSYVGGLVGINMGEINDSYAMGAVNGDDYVGGFAGVNLGTISNSYSTGSVTGNFKLSGFVSESPGSENNCFWDTETSGQENSAGDAEGKTTSEIQDVDTFTDAGWDFISETANGSDDYWDMDQEETVNDGYPILRWQDGADEVLEDLPYSGGSGSSSDPYKIAAAEDLVELSISSEHWDKHFEQTADIVFDSDQNQVDWDGDGTTWGADESDDKLGLASIGNSSDSFQGSYDGQAHTISNLYIHRTESSDHNEVGLFGKIVGATIENLGLVNVSITGSNYYHLGSLVGWINGTDDTVENCYSTGTIDVTDSEYVGGLVGESYGSMIDSYSEVSLSADIVTTGLNLYNIGGLGGSSNGLLSNSYFSGTVTVTGIASSINSIGGIGGLIGGNAGLVESSYSSGNVNAENCIRVGGLIGSNNDTVENSYFTGTVTGDNIGPAGGLTGTNNNSVSNSYNTGSINISNPASTSTYGNFGGLVGLNEGFWGSNAILNNSYSTGSITVSNSNGSNVGGLVGENSRTTLNNSYSMASVTINSGAADDNVGGLVGYNGWESTINKSYSIGKVKGDVTESLGGLVGGNKYNATVNNSFWNTETSSLSTSDGGTGKSTAEMNDRCTFAGWSFASVDSHIDGEWTIDEPGNDNDGYPALAWQEMNNSYGPCPPYVVTGDASDISAASAALNAEIISNGGSEITSRGFCWSTSPEPTISDNYITSASESDEYSVEISGLSSLGTYYVRAYVENSVGLSSYGNEISFTTAPNYSGGQGTAIAPYIIANTSDLIALANFSGHWDKYFEQTSDISFNPNEIQVDWNGDGTAGPVEGFSPIGNTDTQFTGTYNGTGHTVRNLFINRPGEAKIGLFGFAIMSTIENIRLEDVNITGNEDVGGLLGRNGFKRGPETVVKNSYTTGEVSGNGNAVGGLLGLNYSIVSNNYSTASVEGNLGVGGLLGINDGGNVNNNYSTGEVSGSRLVGGLIGYNIGEVNKSYSTASVAGDGGGLIGKNHGLVSNSFWDTETSGLSTSDGGSGKITAEMKSTSTFTLESTAGLDNAWDFIDNPNDDEANDDYWGINPVQNNGYPFLSWQGFTNHNKPLLEISNPGENKYYRSQEDIITISGSVNSPNNYNIIISASIDGKEQNIEVSDGSGNWTLEWDIGSLEIAEAAYTDIEITAEDVDGRRDSAAYTGNIIYDKTPPQMSSLNPADNSERQKLDTNLSITFNEKVKTDTGKVKLYKADGAELEVFDLNSSEKVSGSGSETITINRVNELAAASDYYLLIEAGAVTDLAGNPFSGITNKESWNFKTVDKPKITMNLKSSFKNDSLLPGEVITYTAEIENIGTADLKAAELYGYIPSGTVYVENSTTLNGNEIADIDGEPPLLGGMLVNSPNAEAGFILSEGAKTVVSYQVKAAENNVLGSLIENQLELKGKGAELGVRIEKVLSDDPATRAESDSTITQLGDTAVLEVEKEITRVGGEEDQIKAGDELLVKNTIKNIGSKKAVNVNLEDLIPKNTSLKADTIKIESVNLASVDDDTHLLASIFWSTADYIRAGLDKMKSLNTVSAQSELNYKIEDGKIIVDISELEAGESFEISYQVMVNDDSTDGNIISSSGTISSDNSALQEAEAEVVIGQSPNLKSEYKVKDINGAELEVGDSLKYFITIENIGNAPAEELSVKALIPDEIEYTTGSTELNASDAGNDSPLESDSGLVYGEIQAGEKIEITYQGIIKAGTEDDEIKNSMEYYALANTENTSLDQDKELSGSADITLRAGSQPGTAALIGKVKASGNFSIENWKIELYSNETITAAAELDESGEFKFGGLSVNKDYHLFLKHPESGVVYFEKEITASELDENIISDQEDIFIDPAGIVYNSLNREAVPGAVLTLVDQNGEAVPDNYLAEGQQNQITASDGIYKFELNFAEAEAGEYSIRVKVPAGYLQPESDTETSTIIIKAVGPLDTGDAQFADADPATSEFEVVDNENNNLPPAYGEDTSYYLDFELDQDSAKIVNNNIPIDPAEASLLDINKTASESKASVGGFVGYKIEIENNSGRRIEDFTVFDKLPPGFKYIEDSAQIIIDGNAELIKSEGDRILSWNQLSLDAEQSLSLTYTLVVGTGTEINEEYLNIAYSKKYNSIISNTAEASVLVTADPLFNTSTIIGKVFNDSNQNGIQDAGENGIAGAEIISLTGDTIRTDEYGRYHLIVDPKSITQTGETVVLKLDQNSLNENAEILTANPAVIKITPGIIQKVNFGIKMK
jgi:uncharacterized repeat protein (TIGR01451 family)